MDDEFKLCWKNFQDNIASGFQNLYDRGDLVDVTLACDGKLLHAHKFVLAICSPYFQEIFITNPCKHPISYFYHIIFMAVSVNTVLLWQHLDTILGNLATKGSNKQFQSRTGIIIYSIPTTMSYQ
uniref:BTB domain-containing protein n=1 Tax=Glossina austeni TaxID=7395 RepID=A0A1A9UJQ8_GLOAU